MDVTIVTGAKDMAQLVNARVDLLDTMPRGPSRLPRPTDADGVVGRTRVAYVTNGGQLAVVLVTTNTTESAVELFGFAAVYQPASGGSGVEASGSWGESQIAPGASGRRGISRRAPPRSPAGWTRARRRATRMR